MPGFMLDFTFHACMHATHTLSHILDTVGVPALKESIDGRVVLALTAGAKAAREKERVVRGIADGRLIHVIVDGKRPPASDAGRLTMGRTGCSSRRFRCRIPGDRDTGSPSALLPPHRRMAHLPPLTPKIIMRKFLARRGGGLATQSGIAGEDRVETTRKARPPTPISAYCHVLAGYGDTF